MHAWVRNWWVLLVRGIVALLFGILIAARPGAGLLFIVLLFGAYALVFGAFAIGAAIFDSPRRKSELIVEGVVAIIAGVATYSQPGITALALDATIAVFAIFTGVMQLTSAVRLRREVEHWGWMAASGVASMLFGVLMIALPAAGMLAVTWLIAAYGIVLGVTMIVMSLELRRLQARVRPPTLPITPITPQPA
jgi:uncharacterized membrane protein HdeD (DUF308 family)